MTHQICSHTLCGIHRYSKSTQKEEGGSTSSYSEFVIYTAQKNKKKSARGQSRVIMGKGEVNGTKPRSHLELGVKDDGKQNPHFTPYHHHLRRVHVLEETITNIHLYGDSEKPRGNDTLLRAPSLNVCGPTSYVYRLNEGLCRVFLYDLHHPMDAKCRK